MELNSEQLEAVGHLNGPCLVVANPGSGKTKIIVERIANLIINKNVSQKSIICLTFTNRASLEAKERICKSLGTNKPGFFIGTFHSLCARLIRKIGPGRGYSSNFTILDENDQKDMVLMVARQMGYENIGEKDARKIGYALNHYRDQMEDFSWVENNLNNEPMIKIAQFYLTRCRNNNILDFSGLIFECIKIIEKDKEIRDRIQRAFKYLIIDETQDTGLSQMYLIELLGGFWKNIMLVGDINQSIYGWRGARYQNIQDFVDKHEDCKVIKLPINYRSTPEIIDVASKLIKYNENNENFKMITDNKSGESVKCHSFDDQIKEGEWIAKTIKKLVEVGGFNFSDISCIYRMNKMSEILEQSFTKYGIPYKTIGAWGFYDRKEVKDVISMLKLLANKNDMVAFYRVIGLFPGIGDVTIGKIENKATEDKISLIDACIKFKKESNSVKVKKVCQKMYDIFNKDREFSNPAKCLSDIMEEIDYKNYLNNKYDEGIEERIENIEQIVDSCGEYVGENALFRCLHNISLVNESNDDTEDNNKISLLSFHASKGTENEVIFILGVNQGICPHFLSSENDTEDEERRNLFVGMTRSKRVLYISFCRNKKQFSKQQKRMIYRKIKPSKFLYECGLLKENKNY